MKVKLQRAAMLTAFAVLIGSTYVNAQAGQSPQPAPPSQSDKASPPSQSDRASQAAPDPAPVVGELTRVNADAKTIAVKTAAGAEMVFNYTDATMVSGAGKSVAGLATMSGAKVTVTYRAEGANNVATRIEVKDKT